MTRWYGHHADPCAPYDTSAPDPEDAPRCVICDCREPVDDDGICPDCVRDGYRVCPACGETYNTDDAGATANRCATCVRVDAGIACVGCGDDLTGDDLATTPNSEGHRTCAECKRHHAEYLARKAAREQGAGPCAA